MVRGMILSAAAILAAMPAMAGEFLVKFNDEAAFAATASSTFASGRAPGAFGSRGVRVMDRHAPGRLVKISIAAEGRAEARALAALLAQPGVEYVAPNFRLKAFFAPIDAKTLREQWAVAKVGAEKAWTRAGNRGNRSVTVAVIDTGLDYRHESIKANAVKGYNFRDDNDDPMDKTGRSNPGHGTHCGGIIGATGDVDGGTIGVSPEVSIMPIRFLGEDGSGDLNAAIKSIDFAIEKKVQVISASWGATVPASSARPLIEAVKRASDAGVIFVAAAANDGKDNDQVDVFPANAQFENTISVAASGPSDEKPSWSNFGRARVSLASPGLDIMSTLPSNKYGKLSGTSMATPLVAGLVAFLKAQDPSLTGAQIRSLLQTTGAKVSIQTACNCRIDAFAATDALMNKQMWVVPAAGTFKVGETQTFAAANANGSLAFSTSDAAIATIGADGVMKALAPGDVTVTATDAGGRQATSLPIRVVAAGGGGGGGGGPEDCPFGDKATCDQLCQIMPTLPFCKQ